MLVHFPIVLWIAAVCSDLVGRIFDIAVAIEATPLFSGLGCVLALPVMATGLLEFRYLGEDRELLGIVSWHLGLTSFSWLLFLVALLLRWTGEGWQFEPSSLDLTVSLVALLGLIAGAWLGGRLVYRHAVGVSPLDRGRD